MESAPLVSIVTPFYNTAEFLVECIESVLRQSYRNWEYILVDNCSTDGSAEIAQQYLSRLPGKIRLVHTDAFLSQICNYNFALSQISPNAKYCKIVQADDWIYPECLERMVALAESDPSIGIVSAYRLRENRVQCEGLPPEKTVIPGSEICALHLRAQLFTFGSATTVLYRAEIVRGGSAFYDESALHEDTDACYRVLRTWNFGFVHQVLSFTRVGNDSITTRKKDFGWQILDALLQLYKFGPTYLERDELARQLQQTELEYYRFLARSLLTGAPRELWQYHTTGLSTGGRRLSKLQLLKHILLELLRLLVNPGATTAFLFRRLRAYVIRKSDSGNKRISAPIRPEPDRPETERLR